MTTRVVREQSRNRLGPSPTPDAPPLREAGTVRRVRLILAITLALNLLLIALNAWLRPAGGSGNLIYISIQMGVIVGGLFWVWHKPALWTAQLVGIEAALRASQQRYAELLDNAPDPVLTFDGGGRLLTANPALERLLGRRNDDLIGRPFLRAGVIDRSSRRAVVGIVKALAANGAAPPVELLLVRGDGERIAVESNQRILRGTGASVEAEIILRDLTERRRAQEAGRLRQLAAHLDSSQEQRRQQLARRLHDDLAQPLTALGLNLGWLTWTLPNELTEMKTRAREMETLVSSMIAMVRKTMGELRPAALDDFGLAVAVVREAHGFRERTGIECVADVGTDQAHCTDDRAVAVFRSLQEAFANSAARGARHVRVDLEATEGMIAVRIADDGQAVSLSSLPWDFLGMRERTHLLGGNFDVECPPAGGVTINLRVPGHPPS